MGYPNGAHKELLLGNTLENHKAKYTVVLPNEAFHAIEVKSGEFVMITDMPSPGLDPSKYTAPTTEEMVTKFPQYESMIRRLGDIRKYDTALNIPAGSAPHHQGHGHHHHD